MSEEITPFGAPRIGEVLTRLGIRWMQRDDGAYVAKFHTDADPDGLTIYYAAEGSDGEILAIRSPMVRPLDVDAWPWGVGVCNAWNAAHRWPTAFLSTSETTGTVAADLHVSLEDGVHEALLAHQLAVATSTIGECHAWVTNQISTRAPGSVEACDIADLEQRFTEAS